MNNFFVKVVDMSQNQALVLYRRMGPDLRQLVNGIVPGKMPVGWAFMPENATTLKNAVMHFLLCNHVNVVKIYENDFEFVYSSTELPIPSPSCDELCDSNTCSPL